MEKHIGKGDFVRAPIVDLPTKGKSGLSTRSTGEFAKGVLTNDNRRILLVRDYKGKLIVCFREGAELASDKLTN
mgnify:CR=1 FL=1